MAGTGSPGLRLEKVAKAVGCRNPIPDVNPGRHWLLHPYGEREEQPHRGRRKFAPVRLVQMP